jgi:DNA-binding MarR family transcriptional regulator
MDNKYSCGRLLKQIHDGLEKQANNDLRTHDLTMAQVSVLMLLNDADKETLTLKEIEKALHVAQSTSAGIVSRLEQKGFVESFGNAEDKRIKLVRITQTGRQCCGEARANMDHADDILLAGLSEEERTILRMLLVRVSRNVQ